MPAKGTTAQPKIERLCQHCGRPFLVRASQVAIGNGKFCGHACQGAHQSSGLTERFDRQVEKNGPMIADHPELGPCWLWTGRHDDWGYGVIKIANKHRKAHRVAYERANGAIPDGLRICHRCDRPSCVNPAHLFPGTDKENVHDALRKGRWHSQRTTSDEQVREIRRRYAVGNVSQATLAREFNLSKSRVHRIVNNLSWAHVTD